MKNIRQTVFLATSPKEVYRALLESKKHAKFTGTKASMSQKEGGKFRAYDGYIEGVNIKLVSNKTIVQAWRASNWPSDHYSLVTFALQKDKKGTKLTFTQIGVPEHECKSISQGWKDYYWEPMKALLEK